MSFTSIPNQPIIFHTEDEILTPCEECGGTDYKQLVDFNDQIYFQVESAPCPELFLYRVFEESGGWGSNVSGGNICSTNVVQAGYYATYYNTPYPFQLWKVSFTIASLDLGALSITMDYSTTYQVTLAGEYTFYFTNINIPTNQVSVIFYTTTNGWEGCLVANSIKIEGLASNSQLKVGVVDYETLETIDVISPTYSLKDNKVSAKISLTDVQVGEGCYRLAIADFCTNSCAQFYVVNGLFSTTNSSVEGWNVLAFNAIYEFPLAQFRVIIPDGDGELSLTNDAEFCEGKLYYIQINIETASNIAINAQIGNNQVQFPIGATGIQTIAIVAGSPSIEFGMRLNFFFQATGQGFGEMIISNVTIGIDDSSVTWNYYSDTISIGDYENDCKYFKIEGCNAQDQFNLAFSGSAFLPMIRLEGKKSKAQYVTNANTFRYASGKWNANYVNRLKQWTFHFGRLPEYVLDFLSTIFYYDNCYVNRVLMFPQDNAFPNIDWSDADSYLGSFNIDLVEKEGNVLKVQCLDSNATCLPSSNIVDEPFLLEQDGNNLITEDGINLYYEN
jgi:hypothetical protein